MLESALVMAMSCSGLVASSPIGPAQGQVGGSPGQPDQSAKQPAYLRDRERYQACIPTRISPFLPPGLALACSRTTAK